MVLLKGKGAGYSCDFFKVEGEYIRNIYIRVVSLVLDRIT